MRARSTLDLSQSNNIS